MQFDLSRWSGAKHALLWEENRLKSEEAVALLHTLNDENVARDLLRSLNADDERRTPFWTMAESAAWDLRVSYTRDPLGPSVIGTVPGRELCLDVAHSDVGYYLAAYSLLDGPQSCESALASVHTQGGRALAWGVLTSATKFVMLIARHEQVGAFFESLFDDDSDAFLPYGVPDDGFGLLDLTAAGLIEQLAASIKPSLLRDLLETSAVAAVREGLEWLEGGPETVTVVSNALSARRDSPQSDADRIYQTTFAGIDPTGATASILVGAVISQLTAIPASMALVAALRTRVGSTVQTAPIATAGTIFGLLERLLAELDHIAFEAPAKTLRQLEELAIERDSALDALAWATSEHARLRATCEQLRAERDLLGEQLRAEQRRRYLETGVLRADVEDLIRQTGLDNAVIRELNAFIDSRQRRRLREAMRDIVAGASLGGTFYGESGAIAGAILGLLGAVADDARNDDGFDRNAP